MPMNEKEYINLNSEIINKCREDKKEWLNEKWAELERMSNADKKICTTVFWINRTNGELINQIYMYISVSLSLSLYSFYIFLLLLLYIILLFFSFYKTWSLNIYHKILNAGFKSKLLKILTKHNICPPLHCLWCLCHNKLSI